MFDNKTNNKLFKTNEDEDIWEDLIDRPTADYIKMGDENKDGCSMRLKNSLYIIIIFLIVAIAISFIYAVTNSDSK
jgi:hypothetical protein